MQVPVPEAFQIYQHRKYANKLTVSTNRYVVQNLFIPSELLPNAIRLRKYIPQTLLRDDICRHPDQILHDHIKRIQHFHESPHKIPLSKVTNISDGIPKEQENVFILLDEDLLKAKSEIMGSMPTGAHPVSGMAA
ncbi:hypothetical protein ACTXT7_004160 [Hymenolepis weldensis]